MLGIYRDYARAGFHLARQPAMSKAGLGHKPGDRNHYPMDASEAIAWLDEGGNVSVAPIGDFCFLDVDTSSQSIVTRIEMALGGEGAFRHWTPRKGSHFLVRRGTDRLLGRTRLVEFAGGQIDIKGFGTGYVIGPGSRTEHGRYTGKSGWRVPVVDDAMLDRIVRATDGKMPVEQVPISAALAPRYMDRPPATIDELDELLGHLDPNMGMSDWLGVVFGVRDEYGNNGRASAALAAVDSWSARSPKYKQGEVHRIWNSPRRTTGRVATFGGVVRKAMDSGASVRISAPAIMPPPGDWSGGLEIDD